jgi:ATP-binding cassette subfamily B protein
LQAVVSYDGERNVLDDITLKLRPREKVTFIGRTGVGKTTLFRLVMGLMKPSSGSITVNGYDVFDIPHSEKRKIFGYVDQDFSLIPGTSPTRSVSRPP